MTKKASNEDYITLKIPRALADEVDQMIESKILGYRSRAEFASEAIRRRIEQIQTNNSTKNRTLNRK